MTTLRELFYNLLRGRKSGGHISDLQQAVPKTWIECPNDVRDVEMLLMGRVDESDKLEYFWSKPSFTYDKGMMKIFHDLYVVNPESYDPFLLYISALCYMYELLAHSMDISTTILNSFEKLDIPSHPSMMKLINDDQMEKEIKKASNTGTIVSMEQPSHNTYNILGWLNNHPKLAAHFDNFYTQDDPFNYHGDLCCAHFWVTHYKTVYDFMAWCSEI